METQTQNAELTSFTTDRLEGDGNNSDDAELNIGNSQENSQTSSEFKKDKDNQPSTSTWGDSGSGMSYIPI